MIFSRVSLLAATLAALPLAVFVPGCGGGSNSSPFSSPTPVPTTQTIRPLQFALADGRPVILNLQTRGNRVFGTLNTPDFVVQVVRDPNEPSVDLNWEGGNYNVSGSFTPPLSINLSGQVRQNGVNVPFKYVGTLPTDTTPGTFSVTAGGKTVTVTLPAFGGPTTTTTPSPSPSATATSTVTPAPTAQAIVFNGTAASDTIGSGITTISATGNSKVQRIGNSDTVTGQYTFQVGNETAIFQTLGTYSPRLENRAYFPGSGPVYNIVLTQSNRTFNSYAGDGNVTFLGTTNGVLSFRFQNIAFTEQGKSPSDGFLILNGTGTLTDAR